MHPMEESQLSAVGRVGPGCAHWIHPMYQVCVPEENVTKTTELIVRNGKVFKYIGKIDICVIDFLRFS